MKIVLGWTRDGGGKIDNYHPVEVANCVTASKRDNTTQYVMEYEEKDNNNKPDR